MVSDLAARATTQQLTEAIATREPSIGSLPQSKVANLVSDLAGKASAGELATVNSTLVTAIVTSQTTLETQIDTKASIQQLVEAVATRQPIIELAGLAQDRVAGL